MLIASELLHSPQTAAFRTPSEPYADGGVWHDCSLIIIASFKSDGSLFVGNIGKTDYVGDCQCKPSHTSRENGKSLYMIVVYDMGLYHHYCAKSSNHPVYPYWGLYLKTSIYVWPTVLSCGPPNKIHMKNKRLTHGYFPHKIIYSSRIWLSYFSYKRPTLQGPIRRGGNLLDLRPRAHLAP